MDRKCLNCEKVLKGRSDKKYCNEACRNQYNNVVNSDTNASMRQTQNILRKNRRILAEILGDKEKFTTSLKKLTDKGFKPAFLTEIYKTKAGSIYRYTFEYGILLLDEGKVLIVKKRNNNSISS